MRHRIGIDWTIAGIADLRDADARYVAGLGWIVTVTSTGAKGLILLGKVQSLKPAELVRFVDDGLDQLERVHLRIVA
ncbi:hypothetical protein ASG54_23070 [Aureimonas sp. Leaf460]|nr:hypothetical protein ASG62_24125 [Aureimonas sp. Leaf427]KQT62965.1 hypothetical protein ASG54_23070 [Aureimonas sp. Leaf460]